MIKDNISMNRTKEETKENIMHSIAAIAVSLTEGPNAQSATYTHLLRDAIAEINKFTDYMIDPNNFVKNEYITYAMNFHRFVGTFEGLYSIMDNGELNTTQNALITTLITKLNKLVGNKNTSGIIDIAIKNHAREVIRQNSSQSFSDSDLTDLFEKAKDITGIDYSTGDMATSRDTILAIMDKIYKKKKQELLDRLETREIIIKAAGSKVLKLSGTTDTQKIYEFMQEFRDGKFTGRYVEKIGAKYNDELYRLKQNLFEDGVWREYREIKDLQTAKPEDIEYNKRLYIDRKAYGTFLNAETIGIGGKPIDGIYHAYTDEFKKIRDKYEMFIADGTNGYWIRKKGITPEAHSIFKTKYFEQEKPTTYAPTKNGVFEGQVKSGKITPVKSKYIIKLETSRGGVKNDMVNPKYISIMNPTTALGHAQKEFYEMFVQNFQKDLMNMLPVSVRDQMLGRVPLVEAAFMDNLKNKPNIIAKLWAKTTRSIKNFTTETSQMKRVLTDENDNIIDSLPILYIGNPRIEGELEAIENKIIALNDKRKKNLININLYKTEKLALEGEAARLRNIPTADEIDKDMTRSLLKFAAMAEHYETMGTIEDTLKTMIEVLEKRTYDPADDKLSRVAKRVSDTTGKIVEYSVGRKPSDKESNTIRRAKKWMEMVYYDSEEVTKGMLDKISDAVISASSLSYVAFNPFGNFNNYAMGRINNSIEMIGGRFFDRQAYIRSEIEFNKRAFADMAKRIGMTKGKKGQYDPQLPMSKWEAFVDYLRMMDPKSDIRETTSDLDRKSYFDRLTELGYFLQDAAEYNVQTKIGMAIVMDTIVKNKTTGGTLSLYDAMEYNSVTHDLKLKDGFDTVIQKNGIEVPYSNDFKYGLHINIREVNKQIHGNYAKDDRMVIQSTIIGKFAAQFHKWVAPALKARFGGEYYDENLGWMEGRYNSFIQFMKYAATNIGEIDIYAKTWKEGFMLDNSKAAEIRAKYTDENGKLTITEELLNAKLASDDQRVKNKVFGMYRTLGELGIMMSVIAINQILRSLWSDDDDDETTRRLKNALIYQSDRLYKEMVTFMPIFPSGLMQLHQMTNTPIASSKLLGDFGEAISTTTITGWNGVEYFFTDNQEDWYQNKDIFYQRKPNKGNLKMNKQWMDIIPGLHMIQKWRSYDKLQDFYIK